MFEIAIRCIGGVCRPESQNCSQPLQLSPRPARGNHDLKPHIINCQQQLSLVVVAVRRILQQIWPLCLSWMLQPSASWRTRQLLPQRDRCARTSHLAGAHLRLQQQRMVSLVHIRSPFPHVPDCICFGGVIARWCDARQCLAIQEQALLSSASPVKLSGLMSSRVQRLGLERIRARRRAKSASCGTLRASTPPTRGRRLTPSAGWPSGSALTSRSRANHVAPR